WLLHPRLSPALWIDRLDAHVRWLEHHPEIHVIHIVRHDAVEWLKSKYLAARTGTFAGKAYPEGIKVAIPIGPAKRRLQAKSWVDARLSSLEQTNPYIRIAYEDFLAARDDTMCSLLHFLDCDTADYDETGDTRISR